MFTGRTQHHTSSRVQQQQQFNSNTQGSYFDSQQDSCSITTTASSGKRARQQQRQKQAHGTRFDRSLDRAGSYESQQDIIEGTLRETAQQQQTLHFSTDPSLNTSSASSSGYNSHNNFYSHQPDRLSQQHQQSAALMRAPMMIPMMIDDDGDDKEEDDDQDEDELGVVDDTHLIYDGADRLSQQYKLLSTGIQLHRHRPQLQQQHQQFVAPDHDQLSGDQCVDSDAEAAYLRGEPDEAGGRKYHLGENHVASGPAILMLQNHHDHPDNIGRDSSIHSRYSSSNRLSYQLQQQVLDAARQQQLKLQQQLNQQQQQPPIKNNSKFATSGSNKARHINLTRHHHHHRQHSSEFRVKSTSGCQPAEASIYQQPQHLSGYQQHQQASLTYSPHHHNYNHYHNHNYLPHHSNSLEPLPSSQQHYLQQVTTNSTATVADHSRNLLASKSQLLTHSQNQQLDSIGQQVVVATGANHSAQRRSGYHSKRFPNEAQETLKNEMQASSSMHQLSASPDQHHYARRKNTTTTHKRSTPTPQTDKENDEITLSLCGKFGKSLLFIANLLFWLTGISLGAWGILSLVDDHKYNLSQLLVFEPASKMSLYQLLSWSFITLGCATILVGVCGCSAILKNNRWILGLYIFLILAIFVLDLATGLLAIIFQERLVANVRLRLANKLRSDYGVHASFTAAIDYIQTKFECCGLEGHFDYDQSLWRLQRLGGFEATVARTCCYLRNTFDDQAHINPRPVNESMCQSTDVRFHQSYRYRKGCMEDLERLIRQKIWTFTLGCGAVGAIILVSLFFATCFCRSIPSRSRKSSAVSSSNRGHYAKGNYHHQHHHHNQDKKLSSMTTNAQH